MKYLVVTLMTILSMQSVYSNILLEQEAFELKQQFENKAYELKLEQEQQQIAREGKTDFEFFNLEVMLNEKLFTKSVKSNSECIRWVYQGPGSREDAVRACRGVRNMDCVRWVYQGPGTRMEAARSCRRVHSMECARWVYQGPGTRMEAVQACRGVRDMECVRWVYRGPGTRMDAARACSGGGRRPGNGDDEC